MTLGKLSRATLVVVFGLAGLAANIASGAETPDEDFAAFSTQMRGWNEVGAHAPIDFGPGRGLGRPHPRFAALAAAARMTASVPPGGSDAGRIGTYGVPITWPIIPIHVALLPDGRVMSYGTDVTGARGAFLYFDVWDPSLGTDTNSHLLLNNTTGSDIFCSFQALQWTTGDLMTIGGDLRPIHKPNDSDPATTLFNASNNTISKVAEMVYPRWYGTLVSMPDGSMVALGGRQRHVLTTDVGAPTPEVYTLASGWQALPNATSNAAFYDKNNWFYPRAVVAPNGLLFIATITGALYWLDPTGSGTITPAGTTSSSSDALPIAMYAPGKVLSLRTSGTAKVFDLTGATPVVTATGSLSQTRLWANATVMADGNVMVNGGSTVSNVLTGVAYQNETWNRGTGQWTLGAVAAKPRLYHSIALLLPDGTVLTGGGGTPGPVKNLNAEIFYPPYLFLNDGSGQPAPRPSLRTAAGAIHVGGSVTATVGPTDQISRLTLVKFGAVTHALDIDQRFIELGFTQTGQQITAGVPISPNILMPGYYMMFAFNAAGTPSVASIVTVLP